MKYGKITSVLNYVSDIFVKIFLFTCYLCVKFYSFCCDKLIEYKGLERNEYAALMNILSRELGKSDDESLTEADVSLPRVQEYRQRSLENSKAVREGNRAGLIKRSHPLDTAEIDFSQIIKELKQKTNSLQQEKEDSEILNAIDNFILFKEGDKTSLDDTSNMHENNISTEQNLETDKNKCNIVVGGNLTVESLKTAISTMEQELKLRQPKRKSSNKAPKKNKPKNKVKNKRIATKRSKL
jgi:hypothetical protein